MHVVATAGHVDHGKSTLVRALTGIDPDRLAEEKARGLTIDLGFAWTRLASGRNLALVDVPGHIRFIKNMLAGVGGLDACLFVVAASEGWKPQSEEHLRILDLLGLRHGVVALTKCALVDEATRRHRVAEVALALEGSFLAGEPLVEVDSLEGAGLETLRRALDAMLARSAPAEDRGRPRLWIDRGFAIAGAGTVVTGTLTGGGVAVGDEFELLPALVDGRRPARVRVRALQSHHRAYDSVEPGNRVAVNLAQIAHTSVSRGHALVRPGQWWATRQIDATFSVLPTLDREIGRRGAYQLFIGSAQPQVGLRVLGARALAPGESGAVRLHLPVALPLLPGDRFVVRDLGRSQTLGGGEVLDVDPVLPAARATPDGSVDRVIRERGWVDADLLERLTGVRRPPTIGRRWVVDPDLLDKARDRLRAVVGRAGSIGLDCAGLDARDRAVLDAMADVEVTEGRARPTGDDRADPFEEHPYLTRLRASLFSPPDPTDEGVGTDVLRALVHRGLVVRSEGCVFAAEAVEQAAAVVAGLLARRPQGVTVSEVRQALGTSRKYALPLLAYLDASGITRRRGEVRTGGARLPEPDT